MALFFAGLLISAIFTLVQVIICKYHPKLRKEAVNPAIYTEVTAPVTQQETGREESPEYALVRSVQLRNVAQEAGGGGGGGGEGEGGSAGFLMMGNDAYNTAARICRDQV